MSDYLGRVIGTVGVEEQVMLARTGARPIRGWMTLLGEYAVPGVGTTIRVAIYRRRVGGAYVVYTKHLTCWEGGSDSYEVTMAATPEDVLAALGGDDMRRCEHEAWRMAVREDPALAAISIIEV